MVVTYDAVLQMKQAVKEAGLPYVHFHDGCGGQYFSLDEANQALRAFLVQYYDAQGVEAVFSEDGLHFILEKREEESKK